MRWLKNLFSGTTTPPHRDLNMGLIQAYTLIIPKRELPEYVNRGWREAAASRFRPGLKQIVVTRKPSTLSEVGAHKLVGQTIVGWGGHGHWYQALYNWDGHGNWYQQVLFNRRMLPPFLFGISLGHRDIDNRILVYAVRDSREYVLLNEHSWSKRSGVVVGSHIESVDLTDNSCTLHLSHHGQQHRLEFLKNDARLPRQGNEEARKDAFDAGTISDRLVFQHPGAILWV